MAEATPPPMARERPAAPRPTPGPRPDSACSSRSGAALELTDINPSELTLAGSIGSGQSAEVFEGLYQGETVAIKRMKVGRKLDVKEQIQFNREVAVLRSISHPNLVRLFGVCLSTRPYQLVTEFCGGNTVFELLYNSGIDLQWAQQFKMALDVAMAMEYLHNFEPMIVHRDLKSLNLLLFEPVKTTTDLPLTKVADFGLAKMRDQVAAGGSWGKMTSEVGTLLWMAPECYAGTDYDEKVDIYSYSMCLYEIICMEPPFDAEDPGAVCRLVQSGCRPQVNAVPPTCPLALKTLMTKCWASNPKMRPTFIQIVKTLRSLPTDMPSTVRPTSACRRDPNGFVSKSLARGPYNSLSL